MSKTVSIDSAHAYAWRYMSFGRFVWLLQNKSLWLSRTDLLGDEWEMALAGKQLEFVLRRHPFTPLGSDQPHEPAMERATRIIKHWRKTTFVNCWNVSEHESHALWRVYCASVEGVAIRTTVGNLRSLTGLDFKLFGVIYTEIGSIERTPTKADLIMRKRPMFEHENEVRLVRFDEPSEMDSPGIALSWDPEKHINAIRIHPQADQGFANAVLEIVKTYARALKGCINLSDMADRPPT